MGFHIATIRQLLRHQFSPLRTFHPLPQHSLVARQARQDRLDRTAHQRYRAHYLLWGEQACMGHISIDTHVSGYLDGVENPSGRTTRAYLAGDELFGSEYLVEYT